MPGRALLSIRPDKTALRSRVMLRVIAALICLSSFPLPLSAVVPDADDRRQRRMQCSPGDLEALFRLVRKGDRNAQFAVDSMYGAGECLQRDVG